MVGMKPTLTVINGAGAILEALEDAIKQVKAGNVEALGLILCTPGGEAWLSVSCNEDANLPWAALVAGAASLQHELLANGL